MTHSYLLTEHDTEHGLTLSVIKELQEEERKGEKRERERERERGRKTSEAARAAIT